MAADSNFSGPTEQERTMGQLVAQATQDIGDIVRGEIELAKAELRVDVGKAVKGSGLVGAAIYLLLLVTIMLSIAAGYGLVALGVFPWAAFLIIGVVYTVVAIILVLVAKRKFKQIKAPERTIRSTKESIAAVKGARD